MSTLYDTDFYTWTQKQAALLRDGKVQDIDLANLAEEIESLGKSDRRALRSYLEGLVMHLLKWHYQPAELGLQLLHQGKQVFTLAHPAHDGLLQAGARIATATAMLQ